MKASEEAYSMIRHCEALRLAAYKCPAGVWTIGYGHTKGVKPGDRITAQKADDLLHGDVAEVERFINAECPELNQHQFDALTSFTFNLGTSKTKSSTLLKIIKNNPDNEERIRQEFGRWVYSGRVVLSGLVKRRKAEADLFFYKH